MKTDFIAVSLLTFVGLSHALNLGKLPHRRYHSTSRAAKLAARDIDNAPVVNYTLQDWYTGDDFGNQWDFYNDSDPTNGYVNYLSKDDAESAGLFYVQDDGTTVLAVDDYTSLSGGEYRNSVRISSQKTYSSGLFIADIWAMPHGCSVWPAWWSVGPDWPDGGEIDVIEGVNLQTTNQFTLHTSSGCNSTSSSSDSSVEYLADLSTTQCAYVDGDNSGCAFVDTDNRTYGHEFNMNAGGVYAHLWNAGGISVWFFSRDDIPCDITNKSPQPSTWGTPSAFWSSDDCSIADHFYDHSLTFDTTLWSCSGDWAGSAYSSSGCSGTCSEAVQDPANYKYAKWELNYVAVYQHYD
ncbi:glycoside hydrolase family 16 protein [Fistulina hepatica ATCC 64428]|uniref:Glycoside hydrolase family 16 protein n=1 Tax=Fistulina hepatica ATCC 64428 TaxID=1128425 RepID=A0A0D7AFT1_9AGAR|nr:glycoside hydrolase family 16 protein [Fistulina hepatica ATCC 64428]